MATKDSIGSHLRKCTGCGAPLQYTRKPPLFCSTCSSTCRHAGCGRDVLVAGLCALHYKRSRRFGSTEPPRRSPHLKVVWACAQCSKQMVTIPCRQARFCSMACANAAQSRGQKPRPSWRLTASAKRKRLVRAGDAIDSLKVFERDGWKCQLCGIDTPAALRGSTSPQAPEVDHRIPLSRGGAHAWANVQCACRRCNGKKGNRVPLAA